MSAPGASRPKEPFIWALFSSGGMLAALTLPAAFAILFVAPAAGWIEPMGHGELAALLLHPLSRAFVFVLVALCLVHGAHRFRYTLYDGMQLYHLNPLIAFLTYGTATILTGVAGVLLWLAG